MTVTEILDRAAARLEIKEPNAMQMAMGALTHPVRVQLLAPTGSGKTLAFAIPFISSLPEPDKKVVGLILAPSRELALQIDRTVRTLAAPDYKTVLLYGGHSFAQEEASLAAAPDIVIATPGRLLDHLQRGTVSVHDVTSLVLDEYDKALELGFHKQMASIVGRLKKVTTLILTSATAGGDLPDFIDGKDLVTLDFRELPEEALKPNLEIKHLYSPSADKLDSLMDYMRTLGQSRSMVFVNHREAAERVEKALRKDGFPVALYHGGLDQQMRERALVLFENGTAPILITTDLGARGLDIKDVDNVIHYHLPVSAEAWTHRNGRVGRQGTEGDVTVITSDADKIPPFVSWDSEIELPSSLPAVPVPLSITLYFNAGKKEKISRGDIAGFLIQKGGLKPEQIGRIEVRDHCAYVGVPPHMARSVIEACAPHKLKKQKVRITQIKGM